MTKQTVNHEKTFDEALAAYTDALIENGSAPVPDSKYGTEIADLIDTINSFHSIAISIKPDEVVKKSYL